MRPNFCPNGQAHYNQLQTMDLEKDHLEVLAHQSKRFLTLKSIFVDQVVNYSNKPTRMSVY